MSKGISPTKKAAQDNFNSLCGDGKSPEEIILAVMRGDTKITERQQAAANALLRFRLPALQSVEAHVARTEMSHEEWIESLEDEDDE